jgi:tetratricopeptide (TPR) repeat protein
MLMQPEWVATQALACHCDAERQGFIGWLLDSIAPRDLEDLAQQIKSQMFDPLLGTDLERAQCVASFLIELGNAAYSPVVTALGLLSCGDATRQGGFAVEAMALHQRAGDLFLTAGDKVGWARARSGWLIAACHAGKITVRDVRAMNAARKILQGAGMWYRLAVLEQNIGLAYRYLGRFDASLTAFGRALGALDMGDIPGERLRAMIASNQALIFQLQGNLPQAIELHRQARKIFVSMNVTGEAAKQSFNLAILAGLSGHVRESLELVREAISGFKSAKMPFQRAFALVHRAESLLLLNRVEEAAIDASEAVSALRSFTRPSDLSYAIRVKAKALSRAGRPREALGDFNESVAVAQNAGNWESAHSAWNERIALLLEICDLETATDEAEDLLARPRPRMTLHNALMTQVLLAEIAAAKENGERAGHLAQQVIDRSKKTSMPNVLARAHAVQARLARSQGQPQAACERYDAALAALREMAERLVFDQHSEFLVDKSNLFLEALEAAIDAGDAARALGYLEQERARPTWSLPVRDADPALQRLIDLRQRHRVVSAALALEQTGTIASESTQRELKRLDRAIRDLYETLAEHKDHALALDGAALAQAMPTDLTMLAWAMLPRDLVIFVIAGGTVTARRVADGAAAVRKLDRSLRLMFDTIAAGLQRGDPTHAEAVIGQWDAPARALLGQLWSHLFAPVGDLLPTDGEPLALVPHGALRMLPLAALWDGTRYLAERWRVTIASSCASLLSAEQDETAANQGILAMGYDDHGRVPQARSEAQSIARILGGDALVDEDATCEALAQRAAGSALLHIAAHGVWRIDVPNSSYVQLADGPFHSSDVLALDLRGCRLVTLSACQTSLGRPSGGDEQIGLVRAFGLAGAGAVLASLWRVDDAATAALMAALYRSLAAGASPAEALCQTQQALIHHPDTPYWQHPFFWSAFQLTSLRPVRSIAISSATKTPIRSLIAIDR